MYQASKWLPNSHLMTIWATIGRPRVKLATRRERWELPDGDFLDVERVDGPVPDAPLAIVVHGLEGSADANYVRGTLRAARALGLAGVAIHLRSCSGELNRLARFYHSGETGDLDWVVQRLVAERPGRRLGVVGFSLGGSITANYFGRRGDDLVPELRAGVVVSVPFDLAAAATAIDAPGFMRVYRERFLRQLKPKAVAKAARYPGLIDVARVQKLTSLIGFDDLVTAPIHGFAGAADYYARCSSGPTLPSVRRPFLVLQAKDDPFVPAASLPVFGPEVQAEVSATGGHVGFMSGSLWAPTYWAETRAAAFLADHLVGDRT